MKFPVRFFTASGVMLIASCTYNHIACDGDGDCIIHDKKSRELGHKVDMKEVMTNKSSVKDTTIEDD